MGRRLDTPTEWLANFGSYFLTVAAQNLITLEPEEEEGKFRRFGAELFGLRTYPRGLWDRLKDMRNEYAQKEFGKPYDELNLEQKDKLLTVNHNLSRGFSIFFICSLEI